MSYKFIENVYFIDQINLLSKKFIKINADWIDFKINFNINFGIHLGEGIYKFRCKNSSIPVGKSGGFRIILKVYEDKILPIIIYSKTEKSNVSKIEIIQALKAYL